MSNGIYNILSKLSGLMPKEETAKPAGPIYESVDPKGSILQGVDQLEAKLKSQLAESKTHASKIEEGYDSSKQYGVRYRVFAGREGRLTTKEAWFKTPQALEKAVDKIRDLGNFYEIDSYSYPDSKEEVSESEVDETAAPGQEEWIKDNKAKFIKQYGKEKGLSVLYATAWKRSKSKKNESVAEGEEKKEQKTCKVCKKKFTPSHGEYARCQSCMDKQHSAAEKATNVSEAAKLNELSKDTLGSYVKKSAKDVSAQAAGFAGAAAQGQHELAGRKARKTMKRLTGIDRATDRLTKESAVDEAIDSGPGKIKAPKIKYGQNAPGAGAYEKSPEELAQIKSQQQAEKQAASQAKKATHDRYYGRKSAPKLNLDTVWRKVEQVVGDTYPDGDPIDWLGPWLEKQGVSGLDIGDLLRKAARKNGYKDIYDYYHSFDEEYGYLRNQGEMAEGTPTTPGQANTANKNIPDLTTEGEVTRKGNVTVHKGTYGTDYKGDDEQADKKDSEKKARGRPKKAAEPTYTKMNDLFGRDKAPRDAKGNVKVAKGRVHKMDESKAAKGSTSMIAEGCMLDEDGSTFQHIIDTYKPEVRKFKETDELDQDLFDALYDYYFDDMPYGVKKARSGDPYEWVSNRFADDLGIGMGHGDPLVAPDAYEEASDIPVLATPNLETELTELARLAGIAESKQVKECAMAVGEQPATDNLNVTATYNSNDGRQSITVSAEGAQAAQLAQLLKLSGLMGDKSVEPEQTQVAVVEPSGDEEVEEEREPEYSNTPDEKVADTDAIIHQGNDLNREKKQYADKPKLGDNPMATEDIMGSMGRKLMKAYESIKIKK